MPGIQVAQVASYDFGAPTVSAVVARWSVTRGGEIDLSVSNDGDLPVTISVDVSADDTTYAATSVANNLTAIASVVIPARVSNTYPVLLRGGIDNFFRISASGGVRFNVQLRKHETAGVQDLRI